MYKWKPILKQMEVYLYEQNINPKLRMIAVNVIKMGVKNTPAFEEFIDK